MALQKLIDVAKASVTVSDAVPSTTDVGSLWFESDTAQFFIYYDNTWIEVGGAAVESIINTITGKGQLLVGTESAAVTNLAVGSDNFRLIANSATTSGLQWVADTYNTVIDAKGDLLVGSSADTVTRLPVSSVNGAVLVADSTATNGISWNENNTTNRNLLYNGAMQVAQRNTNVPNITTSNYYTADRWQTEIASLGTWTQTIENDGPTGSGFRKSLKMLCTPNADPTPITNDELCITQKLEGQDIQEIRKGTASAKQLMISFWVKSNVTGTYIVYLYDADNNRSVSKSYTVNTSGIWEYKTINIPADTTGVFDNDNNASLWVRFYLGAGPTFTSGTLQTTWATDTAANRCVGQVNLASATNNYWQITGVQLLVGSADAPFQFKSYERELSECQRYFQRFGVESTQNGQYMFFSSGWFTSTSYLASGFQFPVKMRTRAATSHNGASNFYIDSATGQGVPLAITISTEATQSIRFIVLSSGTPTGGQCGNLLSNGGNTAYFNLDAEL